MEKSSRIISIDIMRGLTLFLMLFVNDLYTLGVPKWLVHTTENEDGMGLADWVFPGFLFMVGLSIPFAIMARSKIGESTFQLLGHIITRTLSLLLIGVFIVNIDDYSEDLTGIDKNLYAISVYVFVFLIWNKYLQNNWIEKLLKLTGIVGLILILILYRSGTPENIGYMSTSWWGILGLIGWGYFVAAITYFLFRDNIVATIATLIGFVILNCISLVSPLDFLDPITPYFGVLINGNVPSIVLAGLLIGILLKKHKNNFKRFLSIIVPLGLFILLFGFVLRNWFIISKILGTPSWAMICNGISILLFALLFYVIDIKKWQKWSLPFLPAGQNSLTTYLAPDILYYLIWSTPLQILIYKQDNMPWLAVTGSLFWAFAMIYMSSLLSKINIRLKL